MRPISALLACVFVAAASAASADSRVFIIANQSDGYGVDPVSYTHLTLPTILRV